jgi:hypothetical protein
MPNQIFKYIPENNILIDFLHIVCLKENTTYIFDMNAYKKGQYNDTNIKLLDDIRPYYYVSKQLKYLDREITYNNFTTILRQLCNITKIKYTSTIKYDRSVYNIKYEIYYPTT